MTAFQTFQKMKIDKALPSLEPFDPNNSCFCYPMGANPIGCEGAILYCFLPDFGETVFACNPESCADSYVYPLAGSFEDFLRLILACGSPNPPEQIVWMTRQQFEDHLKEESACRTAEQKAALEQLAETFSLTSMEDPYSYVKALQLSFGYAQISYSDEYYETLGIER